jgi:hypothetical protein
MVLGFSVAPEIAEEYERLAKLRRKSKSELFREMVDHYKSKLEEEGFYSLQRKMARRARKIRVFTEKDVDRIVFENR